MTSMLIYIVRCLIMLMLTWLGIRLIGKKSIAQMTSYEFSGLLLLTTVAAEPLVYKVVSKTAVGIMTLACGTVFISWLALRKWFYNFDSKPSIVIINGKLDKIALRQNKINLPFLLSLIRQKGYAKISEIEYGIIEPNGQLSILPKSQDRALKPKDLKLDTSYEGLALPLIIDGEIQYNNLKYARLNTTWLQQEIQNAGADHPEQIFLAELDTEGKLYVDCYDLPEQKPHIF